MPRDSDDGDGCGESPKHDIDHVDYDDDDMGSGDDEYGAGRGDGAVMVLAWSRLEAAVQVPAEQRALLSRTVLGFGFVSTGKLA